MLGQSDSKADNTPDKSAEQVIAADASTADQTANADDDLNAKIQAHADMLLEALERQQARQRQQVQRKPQPSQTPVASTHAVQQPKPAPDPQVNRLASALDQQRGSRPASSATVTDANPLPQVQWLDLRPVAPVTPAPKANVASTKPQPKPVVEPTPAVAPVQIVPASNAAAEPADTVALTHKLTANIRQSDQTALQKALALSSLSLSCNENLLQPSDLRDLNPNELQQVRKMHTLVLQTLIKQSSEKADDKQSGADQQSAMNDQINKLFGPASTRIGKIEFCRTVSGYGVYEPFESTTFLAGVEQPLILYVELENFTSIHDGQQFRVHLSQEVALYTDADGVRVWHLPQERIVDVSRNKRRDFFTVQLLHLPARLGVGKYRLKVRIHDVNASSFDEVTVPITLVASQSTTARNGEKPSTNLRNN
ncbi:MAG: hypothetical protein ACF8OB_20205 [Phycisphaeraceae bacterium JB051]